MATGEIDLNGLDEQIKKTDASMKKLADDTALWGENFAKMNFQRMGTDVSALTRNLSSLADMMSKGEGIKGGVRAIDEYTKAMQMLLNVVSSMHDVKLTGNFDTSKIEQGLRNAAREAEGFYQRVVKISQVKVNEITSYSNAQKVNDAKRAELKIQEEINRLIQQGSAKGVNTLLAMGRTVSNLQQIISGLRIAQNNVNQSTSAGKQRYEELGAAIRLAERELEKMQGRSRTLSGLFTNLKGVASQIALSFGIMTGVFGASNFFRQLYSITSNFQLQQKALAAIVDNAREANILFKQMQTLAVESPIKLMDLNKYAKQLAAFRVETTQLYGSLKMLADISVGVGVDMDRLILAFGQVKAANYLRGQELRQFSEAGVNILGGLREYYEDTKGIKLSLNDIFDMVSKRKVLFEDVEAVLKRMTQQGGAFYNMQLIQSQTLYGQVQKLADMFQIEMNKMGSYSSGMLMGFVKIVQFVIKNLQQIVILLTTMATTKGIAKLIQQFIVLNKVSNEFKFSLTASGRAFKFMMAQLKSGDIVGAFKTMTSGANALKLAASAAGIAIGLAVSAIVKHRQEVKQQLQDTILEFKEMNRRLVDIRKLETEYKGKTSYDERLAALQQLVEKAKELNYQLSLPSDINVSNIDKVFKKAINDLEDYTRNVQYFSTVFNDKYIKEAMGGLDKLTPEYGVVAQRAEELFAFYSNNVKKMTETQREAFDEIKSMREQFLEDENKAAQKYNMTREQWNRYFVVRMSELKASVQKEGSLFGTINYLSDDAAESIEYEQIEKKLSKFVKRYTSAYNKAKEEIENQINTKKIKIKDWIQLDKKDLEETIQKEVPAILEGLKVEGDFSKGELYNLLEDVAKLERGTIAGIMIKMSNGNTNLDDSQFNRIMKDVFGEESPTKEIQLKFSLDPDSLTREDIEKMMSDPTIDPLQNKGEISYGAMQAVREWGEVGKVIYKTGVTSQEAKKDLDNLWKTNEEGLRRYRAALKETGDKQQKMLEAINNDLSYKFTSVKAAINELETTNKELKDVYEIEVWDKPKTSKDSSRSQSMKSEYQSMIDFIKKLNTEYDKLRKDFSETTDKYWDGAFERVVSSYRDEFGQMPKKFKEVFKEIERIDFTTKEGAIAGEKLVEGIIKGAKNISEKEKKELLLKLQQTIGDIQLKVELDMKKDADDRLKAHVQKMFDDYSLTVELKKLGIEGYEAADLFGINVTTLSQLQQRLEDLKERFIGQNMEKEYQKFMDKIVEINGKANLEMSKKYVKYLREEYDEIAKLQIEYMKKRAEVYSLPFDEGQQTAILENLQKEMNKKMRKLEWDEFKKSDFYIDMFNDLKNASTSSLQIMNEHLRKMKENMKELSPTELKAINDEMRKIEEEWIRRNPFDGLIEGFKEIKKLRKDETLHGIIEEMLGARFDEKSFGARLDAATSMVQSKILDMQRTISQQEIWKKSAEDRDAALKFLLWGRSTPEEVDAYLVSFEKQLKKINDERNKIKDMPVPSKEDSDRLNSLNEQYNMIKDTVDALSTLKSSYTELGSALSQTELETISKQLGISKEELEELLKKWEQLKNANKLIDVHKKRLEEASKQIKNFIESGKSLFDTIAGCLDILGVETNEVTDAWIEFGDQVFDTLAQIAEVMPEIANSFSDVGNEIEGAVENLGESNDWIGLIVAAVNLLFKAIKALATTKNYEITEQLEMIDTTLDVLTRDAERLGEAFSNAFDQDKIKIFSDRVIANYNEQIGQLQRKIDLENERKKPNRDNIAGWIKEQKDILDKINEQKEAFIEAMGGFGDVANMKSTAEEWASAWYDAFKETGDGLSALEDSFESFLDNVFKKQIMNKLSDKFFGDLFSQLDTIIVKEGGILGNMDEFRNWVLAIRESFEGYSEEAEQITMALRGVAGLGGGLEGLSASIKGMTEDTANALVAYLNSIRFYVSEQNEIVESLRESLTLDGSNNPILSQMRLVARNTSAIQSLFESVVAPNSSSLNGACIKVAMV